MWDESRRPAHWLKMDKGAGWPVFLFAVLIMVCAIPGINLLADLNSRIVLPESLGFIEQIFKEQEEAAAALTERFLQADNAYQLLLNIGLMALLPALAEEMTFRGTLQQLLADSRQHSAFSSQPSEISHAAVWVTAIVFSAIHMQFYGFIPRMLLGALFGYMFVWTGSLWVPVVMHFTNNCLAVLAAFSIQHSAFRCQPSDVSSTNIADTLGAGDTWWLGVLSLAAVGGLLWLFTSRGLRGFVRRTRTR